MNPMYTEKEIQELKNLILKPGYADSTGRTDLDRRADKIRAATEVEKNIEKEIIKELSKFLYEFNSIDISCLNNYIKQTGISFTEIANQYLQAFRSGSNTLGLFQKTELIKMLLRYAPLSVSFDDIDKNLYGLKETEPWLFAAILTKKYPHKGFEFVLYLIKANMTKDTSLLHLITTWFELGDESLNQRIEKELEPLIRGLSNVHKVVKFKLDQLALKISLNSVHAPLEPKHGLQIKTSFLADSEEFLSFKESIKKYQSQKEYEYAY